MEYPRCISVANRIINRTNAHNLWRFETGKDRIKLTGRRLQKILYLCQLFWYTEHDECNMIPENFEAWPNGPVIPEIYNFFSVYQDGDMRPLMGASSYSLSQEERNLINKVVDNTIDIGTEAIIDYTQLVNGPWEQAYKNYQGLYSVIPKNSIRQYIRNEDNQRELLNFVLKNSNLDCSIEGNVTTEDYQEKGISK